MDIAEDAEPDIFTWYVSACLARLFSSTHRMTKHCLTSICTHSSTLSGAMAYLMRAGLLLRPALQCSEHGQPKRLTKQLLTRTA